MKKIRNFAITAMLVLFATGCTEELSIDSRPVPVEEKMETAENNRLTDNFVTENQAIEVANAFFSVQSEKSGLRSGTLTASNASVEIVKDQNNEPLMYVFGDNAVYELVTYWEKASNNGSATYFKCNRIEFEGSVITDITFGDGFSGLYTYRATIILNDR